MVRNLWQEFKAFAFKGNMIDLAVAVVIGTAFAKVVDALVKTVIMPLISYVAPNKAGYEAWHLGRVQFGAFLSEVLNFLIVALAVFLIIVKVVGAVVRRAGAGAATPAEPTTKECPLCLSMIPLRAKRCAHCTADLAPTGA